VPDVIRVRLRPVREADLGALEEGHSRDADPERLWTTAKTGPELLKRVSSLPGFGAQKAQIFVALLGKQLGVRPRGWREAAGPFGAKGSHLSVADISDADSLARVRSYKQGLKAAAKAAATAKTP